MQDTAISESMPADEQLETDLKELLSPLEFPKINPKPFLDHQSLVYCLHKQEFVYNGKRLSPCTSDLTKEVKKYLASGQNNFSRFLHQLCLLNSDTMASIEDQLAEEFQEIEGARRPEWHAVNIVPDVDITDIIPLMRPQKYRILIGNIIVPPLNIANQDSPLLLRKRIESIKNKIIDPRDQSRRELAWQEYRKRLLRLIDTNMRFSENLESISIGVVFCACYPSTILNINCAVILSFDVGKMIAVVEKRELSSYLTIIGYGAVFPTLATVLTKKMNFSPSNIAVSKNFGFMVYTETVSDKADRL
ncbi:hypothetical protein ACOME3_000497 [Neoechinorhynchus agilis]